MVEWEEIELRLAVLQILLQTKLDKLKDFDLSKTPPAHRKELLSYYFSVLHLDGPVAVEFIAELLQLEKNNCMNTIDFLVNHAMIAQSKSGYQVTNAGFEYISDVLSGELPE